MENIDKYLFICGEKESFLGDQPMTKVLIVEDNIHFRGPLRKTLKGGYPICRWKKHSTAKKPWTKPKSLIPSLIIMDIRLPPMPQA